jgi:hypothetical protein
LTNVIGNPLETTSALSHLIFEGTLDRLPGLKLCAAHGGGYLPSYSARSDHGCLTFPERCSKTPLKKRPTEYLRQLYCDSLIFTPEALRHLVAECGASQIVMGTDYPYPWTSAAVDHILETPSLEQRRAGGNAGRYRLHTAGHCEGLALSSVLLRYVTTICSLSSTPPSRKLRESGSCAAGQPGWHCRCGV